MLVSPSSFYPQWLQLSQEEYAFYFHPLLEFRLMFISWKDIELELNPNHPRIVI